MTCVTFAPFRLCPLESNILADKGTVSHDQAVDKATKEYKIFRVRQDREYISDFDRETEKYLKGE